MGMFDYVQCDMSLPDGATREDFRGGFAVYDGSDSVFQTKAFERIMTTYRITEEGDLVVRTWDMAPTGKWFVYDFDNPLGDPKYVDPPEDGKEWDWNEALAAAEADQDYDIPHREYERVNERWEPVDFTGTFNFYSSDGKGEWHEYLADVEKGKVTNLRVDEETQRFFARLSRQRRLELDDQVED